MHNPTAVSVRMSGQRGDAHESNKPNEQHTLYGVQGMHPPVPCLVKQASRQVDWPTNRTLLRAAVGLLGRHLLAVADYGIACCSVVSRQACWMAAGRPHYCDREHIYGAVGTNVLHDTAGKRMNSIHHDKQAELAGCHRLPAHQVDAPGGDQ